MSSVHCALSRLPVNATYTWRPEICMCTLCAACDVYRQHASTRSLRRRDKKFMLVSNQDGASLGGSLELSQSELAHDGDLHCPEMGGVSLSKTSATLCSKLGFIGLPSPRGSAGKDWTVLEAAPNSLGPSSESAPTWGKVLGSLKSWGITPATQSAATSRIPTRPDNPQDVTSNPQGQDVSASQQHSDDESRLLEGEARAVSDSEGLKAPLARRRSLRRGRSRGGAGSSSSQQQDRLRNSLDSSQVHSCTVQAVLSVNFVVKALLH